MQLKSTFILLLLLCVTCSFSQQKEHVFHDGYKRTWLVHLPDNYSSEIAYPLVIALHGGGGSAKQIMRNTKKRFNQLAVRDGFIVVYPQGIKKSWNDNEKRDINGFARKENIDDVGFIKKMISQLESNYNIKSEAIFACGISNGGLMSQTLALELSDKIKAIGMVASNFGKDQIEESLDPKPFPILFIHGVDDPVFPYEEGEIGVFNKPRGSVLGIEKSVSYMLNLNGNETEPIISVIENSDSSDGCHSEYLSYPNPDNPSLKVDLIKVYNGGHTWPGATEQRLIRRIVGKTTQDFKACDALWAFFKSILD